MTDKIGNIINWNKSDVGKQREQKDTVIPMTNPDVRYHGKLQTMKLLNGDANGLKQVLEERGFPDLHKLEPNVCQCVPLRVKIAAWHISSASRMTSKTNPQCLRL